MLKSSLLTFVVLLTIACLSIAGRNPQAAAAERKNSAKDAGQAQAEAQSKAKAKEIYQRDCALCHGNNGNGKTDLTTSMNLTMADWTDPKTLADKPDSALFAIIRNGKGTMPAEETGRASDAEVKSLIAYIRDFAKAQPASSATSPAPAQTAH